MVSLAITALAVVTPLIFHRLIKDTALNFLYVRPAAFRIVPARQLQAHDGKPTPLMRPPLASPQASGD
jgi:hypothetical protein